MDCYNCGELKLILVGNKQFYCEKCIECCQEQAHIIVYNSTRNIWTKSKLFSTNSLLAKFLFMVELTTFITRLSSSPYSFILKRDELTNIVKSYGTPELCLKNLDSITPNIVEESKNMMELIRAAVALIKL